MSSPERSPPANGNQKRQRADAAEGDAQPEAKRIATLDKDGEITHVAKAEDKPVAADTAQTHPIQSTASASTPVSHKSTNENDPSHFHARAKLSTKESSVIIGKAGGNISHIRQSSSAKVAVSTYAKGVSERIVTVVGPTSTIAEAFKLIAETLNVESSGGNHEIAAAKTCSVTLLIPEALASVVLGDGFARIQQISSLSGAHVNLSAANLPGSTERALTIEATPAGIKIAVYEVIKSLEMEVTRTYGSAGASAYATREGAPLAAGSNPGALLCVAYHPRPPSWGHSYRREPYGNAGFAAPYEAPAANGYAGGYAQAANPYYPSNPPVDNNGYNMAPDQAFEHQNVAGNTYARFASATATNVHPMGAPFGGAQGTIKVTQIYIPNDMVGAVIGKQGAKINDIRQQSGANIKINESQEGRNDRLVTITGTDAQNRIALSLLQHRIGEERYESLLQMYRHNHDNRRR